MRLLHVGFKSGNEETFGVPDDFEIKKAMEEYGRIRAQTPLTQLWVNFLEAEWCSVYDEVTR